MPGIIKAFASLVAIAIFGLGLGALVRNQAAAMVIGIFYFSIIDGLLSVIPWERRVMSSITPGAALAIVHLQRPSRRRPVGRAPARARWPAACCSWPGTVAILLAGRRVVSLQPRHQLNGQVRRREQPHETPPAGAPSGLPWLLAHA